MAWISALGPLIGALGGVVTGAIQRDQAAKAAQALPDPMSFSPTPQMVKAEEMLGQRAEKGLSPEELRVARQGITRSRGVAGRMMENMGLSRISQGMSNIYGVDAEMNLAALNAKAKQDAMNRYLGVAQGFQNIKDQEVSSFNQMLNQQRMALGQAAASGGKNILSGIATGVQGLATNQLAKAYANSGDTYNYNLGGGSPMGKMEAPTSDLLPTVDTSAPPAIPAGAGYPGVTFDPYAPTSQTYQLPTNPLETPQIPYSAGGAGYGVASDLGAYGPSQAVQPNPILLGASSQNPNSAFNSMMNRMSPLNPFGSFQ
jgi:hypothetical protein